MAKQTAAQLYQQLTAAGFSPAAAAVMDAIGLAESDGDDTAKGDVGLEDTTWGPSYGLYQIRTVKADTGTGGDRDVAWLSGSDANQAAAAYTISAGGTNFTPWSTYVSGVYQQFLGQAQAAAAAAGATTSTGSTGASTTGTTQTVGWGPAWLPWNLPGAIAGGVSGEASSILQSLGGLGLTAAFVILGVGLVGAGVYALSRPVLRRQVDRVQGEAEQGASTAAAALL